MVIGRNYNRLTDIGVGIEAGDDYREALAPEKSPSTNEKTFTRTDKGRTEQGAGGEVTTSPSRHRQGKPKSTSAHVYGSRLISQEDGGRGGAIFQNTWLRGRGR